jgi:hypothetical protein
MSVARYSAEHPCPVCGGHSRLAQGQGVRCFGFVGTDGWCLCTREGGGNAPYKDTAQGWSHRMRGPCPCGNTHAEESGAMPPPRRSAPAPAPRAEVRELGEARGAEIEATYDYRSKDGGLLYQVVRYRPKTFRQRRPHPTRPGAWVHHMVSCADAARQHAASGKSGRPCDCGLPAQPTTLYRIPELVAALGSGDPVYIVEGEKDADAVWNAGGVATCNTGGAGKWRDELAGAIAAYAQPGSTIRIVQDIDPETSKDGKPHLKGQRHARAVYDSLRAALPESISVAIVQAAEGHDAADHLAAGRGLVDFVTVWPEAPALLEADPGAFKRSILRQALTMNESALMIASTQDVAENPPQFRSPLRGDRVLAKMQGCVTIAGGPSAGKSYFALGTAIDNAMDPDEPWDVFYFSCEMSRDYVVDRALRAAASIDLSPYECQSHLMRAQAAGWAADAKVPSRFTLVDVGIGVTMEQIIEFLAEHVGKDPTLVVLDSISSLVDNMDEVGGDSFGMTNLRSVSRYATAVRRLTRGHVAWMILSELNKEGRAKGRSLDHRSDLAISMVADPDQGHLKTIKVTKSWFSATGLLGEFCLHPEIARLVKVNLDG